MRYTLLLDNNHRNPNDKENHFILIYTTITETTNYPIHILPQENNTSAGIFKFALRTQATIIQELLPLDLAKETLTRYNKHNSVKTFYVILTFLTIENELNLPFSP